MTAAVLVGTIALGACGGNDDLSSREQAMEDQAAALGIDADVTLDDEGKVDQVTVQGLGGATAGQNLDLPAGFPEDVPLNPDWNVTSVSPFPPAGYILQALSNESVEAARKGIRERFTAAGWTETASGQPSPQMTTLGFEKGDRMTNVNLIAAGRQLTVQLSTLPKP
jgi:hypothetical protein